MPGIKKWVLRRMRSATSTCRSPNNSKVAGNDDRLGASCTFTTNSLSELAEDAGRSPQRTPQTPPEKTDSVKTVERWIELWRQKRLDEVVAMSSPDCQYHVTVEDEDPMKVRLQDFIDQMQLTYDSFPDYDSTWESVEWDASNGAVIIKNFTGGGTHTGKPFAFGPFPPLPAMGLPIKDDPVSLHVFLKDGKPNCIKTVSKGGQIGPAWYYTQIGGVII